MAKVAKRVLKTMALLVTGYVTIVTVLVAISPYLTKNHEEDNDLDGWDLFDEEYDDDEQEDMDDEDEDRIMNSI